MVRDEIENKLSKTIKNEKYFTFLLTFTMEISIMKLWRFYMDNNVLSIINENYSALTKTQKKLADFIKDNVHMIPFLSIAELGEKTQVSLASITRFTRELGFNGYSQFQKSAADLIRKDVVPMRELKHSITEEGEEDILSRMIRLNINSLETLNSEDLKRNFQQSVDLITGCRKLYITAARSSFSVAYYLYFMLKEFMEHVELLTEGTGDISNKLQYIEKEDCLIAISYERYTRATYNIVSYLNKKGCPVIAVTDSHSSPIALKATTVLLAKHAVDTYSFVNSMTVANALITAAGRRDKDNTLKKLERQDEIALEYGLYL